MIEHYLQAFSRIIATGLPIAFVFTVVGHSDQDASKSILLLYSFINLISIASRAGLEPYINQVFSTRFHNKRFLYPAVKIMLMVSCASACFSILGKIMYVDVVETHLQIESSIIVLSTVAFTMNAVLVHFLQARKAALPAIFIGLIYPYIILIGLMVYSPGYSAHEFFLRFLLSYISSGFVMLILLGYKVYGQQMTFKPDKKKQTPIFKYSFALWLSNFTGRGKLWFLQVLLAGLLNTEAYLSFMELLRIAQIPIASLVGANFISHDLLNHRDSVLDTKKVYFKICKISSLFALLSILTIPCYFLLFNNAQLLTYGYVMIAWALGFFVVTIGPVGVLFNIINQSGLIIMFRLVGFVVTCAFVLLNHNYFYSSSIITILLIIFLSEFVEKTFMVRRFLKRGVKNI